MSDGTRFTRKSAGEHVTVKACSTTDIPYEDIKANPSHYYDNVLHSYITSLSSLDPKALQISELYALVQYLQQLKDPFVFATVVKDNGPALSSKPPLSIPDLLKNVSSTVREFDTMVKEDTIGPDSKPALSIPSTSVSAPPSSSDTELHMAGSPENLANIAGEHFSTASSDQPAISLDPEVPASGDQPVPNVHNVTVAGEELSACANINSTVGGEANMKPMAVANTLPHTPVIGEVDRQDSSHSDNNTPHHNEEEQEAAVGKKQKPRAPQVTVKCCKVNTVGDHAEADVTGEAGTKGLKTRINKWAGLGCQQPSTRDARPSLRLAEAAEAENTLKGTGCRHKGGKRK
ncbi:hypothetical protein Moror_5638 [Moniliophthora roreri MCA 2997]|uniref:Uncharacterized protein n=1 Tax=Moniliophthora roreri (strain MCA 2997) TaxID=1381753 RepID=V2XTM4_MONRO|nr:hypothetical protein Moror_5638 [Moniliophthora roreri MCA 2997]